MGGKVRKYYSLTGEGQRALDEAKDKIRELVSEVLERLGPTKLALIDDENQLDQGEGKEEGKKGSSLLERVAPHD